MNASMRVDGKVITRRQFIIDSINDGWVPQKEEGVTSWYGSRWNPKESKPRTEYQLYKDGYVYKISKTEYDFAVYLTERNAASNP